MGKAKKITIVGAIVILAAFGALYLQDYGTKQFWIDRLNECDAAAGGIANYCIVDLTAEKGEINILVHSEDNIYNRYRITKDETILYAGYPIAAKSKWGVEYFQTYGDDKWLKLTRKAKQVEIGYTVDMNKEMVVIYRKTPYYAYNYAQGTGGFLLEEFQINQDWHKYNISWVPYGTRENSYHRLTWDISNFKGDVNSGQFKDRVSYVLGYDTITGWKDARADFNYVKADNSSKLLSVAFNAKKGTYTLDPSYGVGLGANDWIILLRNTDQCLGTCEAEFEITNPTQDTIQIDQTDWGFSFEKTKASNDLIKYEVYRLDSVSHDYNVPEWGTCSSIVKIWDMNYDPPQWTDFNSTGNCLKNYRVWTEYEEKWIKTDYYGDELLPNETKRYKLIGYRKPKLGENTIDWIPKVAGIEARQYDLWASGWTYRRAVTVKAGNDLNIGFPIDVNLAAWVTAGITNGLPDLVTASKAQLDYDDIRVTYGEDTEISRTVERYNSTDKNAVWFELQAAITAGNTGTYYIWYGNAAATAPANTSLTFPATDVNYINGTAASFRTYHLDEGTGAQVRDSSNNWILGNKTKSDSNFAGLWDTNSYSGAYDLSFTVDDNVDLGFNAVDMNSTGQGSIEFFFKGSPLEQPTGSYCHKLFAAGDTTEFFYLEICTHVTHPFEAGLGFYSSNAGGAGVYWEEWTGYQPQYSDWNNGQWHHLLYDWNSTGAEIFYDGYPAAPTASEVWKNNNVSRPDCNMSLGARNMCAGWPIDFATDMNIADFRISTYWQLPYRHYQKSARSMGAMSLVSIGAEEGGNSAPDVNVQYINSENQYPNTLAADLNRVYRPNMFTYSKDKNLVIRFQVADKEADDLNFNMWWGTTVNSKTNLIVSDVNLSHTYCLTDINKENYTLCSWDWNTFFLADGNYFVTIEVRDAQDNTDTNGTSWSTGILIDNNGPFGSLGMFGSTPYPRADRNVWLNSSYIYLDTLFCNDGTKGTGCHGILYRTESDFTSTCNISGLWVNAIPPTYPTGYSPGGHADGNRCIDYFFIDKRDQSLDANKPAGTIDANRMYFLRDTTDPKLSNNNLYSGKVWQTADFTVAISCDDSVASTQVSGCRAPIYRRGNSVTMGSWTWYTSAGITITTDGNHVIDYNGSDWSRPSNETDVNRIYALLDKTAPTVTIRRPTDLNMGVDWNRIEFDLNESVSDLNLFTLHVDINGVSSTRFSLSNCTDFSTTSHDANWYCAYDESAFMMRGEDYNLWVSIDNNAGLSGHDRHQFKWAGPSTPDGNYYTVNENYLGNSADMNFEPEDLLDQNVAPVGQTDALGYFLVRNLLQKSPDGNSARGMNVSIDLNQAMPNDTNMWISDLNSGARGLAWDLNEISPVTYYNLIPGDNYMLWLWADFNLIGVEGTEFIVDLRWSFDTNGW